MADHDRTDRRPIPPPPRRAPDIDDDLEAAFADTDTEPAPTPKQRRSEFQTARKMLVDLLVAGSHGRIDHTAFNGVEIDDLQQVAAEHGVRPWQDTIVENKRLREALSHEVAGRTRHVTPEDLNIFDFAEPFDIDAVNARATEIAEQRSEGARSMLVAALAEMGVDTGAAGFDLTEVLQRAANPAPAQPELPQGHYYISTPETRTANLPTGRTPTLPPRLDQPPPGTDTLEWAAAEYLAEGRPR